MSNGGGSVKIGGGSITIECDKWFDHTTDADGNHVCKNQDKNMRITEVVITDDAEVVIPGKPEQQGNAYLKIDAKSLKLPEGKNIFIKVHYKGEGASAAAATGGGG